MGGLSSDYRRELEEKAKRMEEEIDAKRAVSRQGGVMDIEKDNRAGFEKYRDQRNAELERAGRKPGSQFHVDNSHWQTWLAAKRDAQRPRDARVEPPPCDNNYLVWIYDSWEVMRFIPDWNCWCDVEISDYIEPQTEPLYTSPFYLELPPAPEEN